MHLHLYYFHDPMCSWCWAFIPFWNEIVTGLPANVTARRVLGGLAPDTDQPMPTEMQTKQKAFGKKFSKPFPARSSIMSFGKHAYLDDPRMLPAVPSSRQENKTQETQRL